jgi:hypothetical protein
LILSPEIKCIYRIVPGLRSGKEKVLALIRIPDIFASEMKNSKHTMNTKKIISSGEDA